MNKVILGALIALSVLLTSCDIGEVINFNMTADINGTEFTSLVTTGVLIKESNVQTKNVTLIGTNGSNSISVILTEVGGDSTVNCIATGLYEFGNTTKSAVVTYTEGQNLYTEVISARVELTDCDEETNVTGTFEAQVVTMAGDTATLSNGVFEEINVIEN
ncbi:MAG: hypothetical protein AAFY71_00450 [Bacteroidota bacterium]